jgi:APA family basic amino acid/polyamine antiporter
MSSPPVPRQLHAQSASPSTLTPARTPHKLGLIGATALVVGNIVGVGVFMLPASLAPFGWSTMTGWALTLSGSLCLAWVFAVLAKHLPHAGGATGILGVALGRGPAFVTAWGYWMSACVSNAAITIGGVSYLGRLVPSLTQSPMLAAVTGCSMLALLGYLNSRGLKVAGAAQVITTVVKMLPFVVALGVAALLFARGGTGILAPFDASTLTFSAATGAAALTLYSMLGLECAAMPAEAVNDPERTVPRATMIGTVLTGVLSMSVTGLLVLTMPAAALAVSAAPVADFVSPVLGRGVGTLITLCVVIGAFGALNGWVLVVGEVPAAMADHGLLPAWWGKRNARGAAMNSVLVSGVLACVLIMLNGSPRLTNMYTFVLLLSTTTTLALYLLAPVAALVLAYRGTVPRTPALLLASAGAIAFACFAFAGAGLEANLWGLLLIFAGVPLHLYMQRRGASHPAGQSVD